MPIVLSPDATAQALASIKRYAREELDLDVGDLKAGSLLEFFLKELGPTVYNTAVADAQRYMQDRALDLEGACHQEEFGFWAPPATKGRGRR